MSSIWFSLCKIGPVTAVIMFVCSGCSFTPICCFLQTNKKVIKKKSNEYHLLVYDQRMKKFFWLGLGLSMKKKTFAMTLELQFPLTISSELHLCVNPQVTLTCMACVLLAAYKISLHKSEQYPSVNQPELALLQEERSN